jgi:hypothetical protein
MSETRHSRDYCFHGLNLKMQCSAAMAECLDSRFRLLPSGEKHGETLFFDFHSVADAGQHRVVRPEGKAKAFYNLPSGEACYFEAGDQVYLSFGDGVRALGRPGLGGASISVVESGPVNLFMASHLILTILLVEMLKRRGCYSMHAAGFTKDGKAILIPGTSGAGKSTLTITLLRGGFGFLSDDMTFLRRCPDGLEVLGFPEDVDVSDKTIGFFPELDFLGRSPKTVGFTKKQVRADEVYGAVPVRQARPAAIVLPKISGEQRSVVRPIDADEALLDIVSNVLLTEGQSCQDHLSILSELVKQTPCYRLATGRDFDDIPVLLHGLLSGRTEKIYA